MAPLSFGQRPRRRRPSLTPMIDVVFLLLVFFMLAARFGVDRAIPLSPAPAGGTAYEGTPRLVSVAPDRVLLNGSPIAPEALGRALAPLMPSDDALVAIRPVEGADLQAVVLVLDHLASAGIRRVVLAE